jgi:acyl-CoA reductase-like NAD-dependent aldehyde dehydrogenase
MEACMTAAAAEAVNGVSARLRTARSGSSRRIASQNVTKRRCQFSGACGRAIAVRVPLSAGGKVEGTLAAGTLVGRSRTPSSRPSVPVIVMMAPAGVDGAIVTVGIPLEAVAVAVAMMMVVRMMVVVMMPALLVPLCGGYAGEQHEDGGRQSCDPELHG